MIGHSLPLYRGDGPATLSQPCAALAERCCTIYTDRPARCRTYACALHKAVEQDSAKDAEAHEIVAEATRQAASIRALADGGEGPIWDVADAALHRLPPSSQRDELVDAMACLTKLLFAHFDRDAAHSRGGSAVLEKKRSGPGLK